MKRRLALVQTETNMQELEKKIGMGQIEEVIEQVRESEREGGGKGRRWRIRSDYRPNMNWKHVVLSWIARHGNLLWKKHRRTNGRGLSHRRVPSSFPRSSLLSFAILPIHPRDRL